MCQPVPAEQICVGKVAAMHNRAVCILSRISSQCQAVDETSADVFAETLELPLSESRSQAFCKLLIIKSVLLRMDNVSVLQYINKKGGTKSQWRCSLTLKFLNWCPSKNIVVTAVHLAGVDNSLADSLLRNVVFQTE